LKRKRGEVTMGFLKNLFGKKDEEKKPVQKAEVKEETADESDKNKKLEQFLSRGE